MTAAEDIRLLVRQRANFVCEYCGVSEVDAGGELTIDHFRPRAKGGSDEAENLLYCCFRCNLYKADYWPRNPADSQLWNPRHQSATDHFIELADGRLFPIGRTAEFTLTRLRLNRDPLVLYRLRKIRVQREQALQEHNQEVLRMMEELRLKQVAMLTEQQELLRQQRALLQLLSNKPGLP